MKGLPLRRKIQNCLDPCLPKPPMPHNVDPSNATAVGLKNVGPRVRVEPPWNGFSHMTEAQYDRVVSAPTTEDRWFTPRHGWPTHVHPPFAGPAPVNLMPTADDDPTYFLPEKQSIGELRVELLETDGLKHMDMYGFENDVYSIVVFEDAVASTQPIKDVNNPRFHNEVARAFRFPIHSPHSCCYIGLFDSDSDEIINSAFVTLNNAADGLEGFLERALMAINKCAGREDHSSVEDSSLTSPRANRVREGRSHTRQREKLMREADDAINGDDPIGRVVLDLRTMHPHTVYDTWFELRGSRVMDDKGVAGAVRIRYSFEWTAPERRRLVAYAAPPPLFVTQIDSEAIRQGIDFALEGKNDMGDDVFRLPVFKVAISPISRCISGCVSLKLP